MKKITLPFVITCLMMSYCTDIFADVQPSTSSSVTNTITSGGGGSSSPPVQATTYTTTVSTTSSSIDDDIVTAVYAKYAKDPALIGTKLTVSSQNGIVTVSGTVTAQSQADEASIAAKSVTGVKDVRSNINVTTNPNPYQPPKRANY